MVVVTGLAQILKSPPPEYVPPTTKGRGSSSKELPAARAETNYRPSEMLKTWQFYVLWFMYACGAGAGLMIISKLAKIASVQAGIELGFVLVVALAVGNGIRTYHHWHRF